MNDLHLRRIKAKGAANGAAQGEHALGMRPHGELTVAEAREATGGADEPWAI